MAQRQGACCSSPATICYWLAASLISWGALGLIGIYWYPLHASSAATILLGMAIGCAANWLRNRTLHCAITSPVFLVAGMVFLISGAAKLRVDTLWVWIFIFVAVCVAFFLEWRYAKRSTPVSDN